MKKITTILIIFFLQGLIHNIGHPVTPAFLRELNIQNVMFGVYFSMMALGLMIGGPIFGHLGDQGKKKFWVFIGLILYSIGQFGFGFANDQIWMAIFRLIAGFGVIALHVLLISKLIEQTPKEKQTQALGMVTAVSLLGAGLGYFFGGLIQTNAYLFQLILNQEIRNIFLIQAVLNVIFAIYILIAVEEHKVIHKTITRTSLVKNLVELKKNHPSILLFFFALFFITLGNVNIIKYLEVYFIDLGYTSQDLGTHNLVVNVVALVTSLFILPLIATFKKQLTLMSVIYMVSAILVVIVFRVPAFLLMMYSVFLIYVMLRTIFTPLEQSYIAKQSKENKYGTLMGVRQSFVSLGMVIGPLFGGILYDIRPEVLFNFSAFMFLIGVFMLFIYFLVHKKKNQSELDLKKTFEH
jgi:DHA1 family multidrug resistance protein-like MFS transporter